MEERGIVDGWSVGRPEPQRQLLRHQGEKERDYQRRFFKESLMLDLVRLIVAAGGEVPTTMDWDLADLGCKFQVRLVGWPDELSGDKHQPKPKFKLTSEAKAILIPLLRKKHRMDDSDDEEEGGGEEKSEDEDEEKSEDEDEDEDAQEKRQKRFPRLERWTRGK